MIAALNLLQGFDLRALGANSPGSIRTLVEARKLAHAGRDTYDGGPEFPDLPPARRALTAPRASLNSCPGKAGSRPGRNPSRQAGVPSASGGAPAACGTDCLTSAVAKRPRLQTWRLPSSLDGQAMNPRGLHIGGRPASTLLEGRAEACGCRFARAW